MTQPTEQEKEQRSREERIEWLKEFRQTPLWQKYVKPELARQAEVCDTISDLTNDPVVCFAWRRAFRIVAEIIEFLNQDTPR